VLSLPSKAEKLAALTDPDTRARLIQGLELLASMPASRLDPANFVIRQCELDRNKGLEGRTLGDVAAERGTTAGELLIDLSLEEDLGTWFMRADIGHNDGAAVGGLLAHPYVHVGASDGGAHVGSFATYGDTGYLMSRYVRDTGSLRLEEAVKKITSDPCTIWDLPERGLLKEGYIADVAVFDADTIDRGPEVASDDFPGDGIRWIRRSVGMDTVLVGGGVAWDKTEGYVDGARAGGLATR
jgi:N-acyl-D-aspartate/D-glutamate deacylase